MKSKKTIALALSGGGMRSAIYHLGVLQYLAKQGLYENIKHISTVSGAGLCVGLIYSEHQLTWPNASCFLTEILPNIRERFTKQDIQLHALWQLLVSPWYWNKKVNLLARVMEQRWNLCGCLCDLSEEVLWTINTTAFETGQDFLLSKKQMGEANHSQVLHPHMKIAAAVAASAGFPILIGPYRLKTGKYLWYDRTHSMQVRPHETYIHLWDGGVYDNLGLEPLFSAKGDGRLSKGIDYLIISDASLCQSYQKRSLFPWRNIKRLLDIRGQENNAIRIQEAQDLFHHSHNGIYLGIGSDLLAVLNQAPLSVQEKTFWQTHIQQPQLIEEIRRYPTTLRKVAVKDFDAILRHGYETAAVMLACEGWHQQEH